MSIILFIFIILSCVGMSFAKTNSFFDDYLSKESTLSVKGIFVWLIFMSHFFQYISEPTSFDSTYILLRKTLGQLVVTLFLFYSGYGIYVMQDTKGLDYVRALPKKIVSIYLQTFFAILIFLILQIILGHTPSLTNIGLSFLLWDNLGNNNWYIFAIILLYLFSFFTFRCFISKKTVSISIIFILTCIMIFVLSYYRDSYWYNTLLCYPVGMLYARFKSKIDVFINKNTIFYSLGVLLLTIAFFLTYNRRTDHYVMYELFGVTFSLLIVLISMKVKFCNDFLLFLGNYLFEIYMLQRIPMIILQERGTIEKQPYFSFIICFVFTIFICLIFRKVKNTITNSFNSYNR